MLAYCCLYVRLATLKGSRLLVTSANGGFARFSGSEGGSLRVSSRNGEGIGTMILREHRCQVQGVPLRALTWLSSA